MDLAAVKDAPALELAMASAAAARNARGLADDAELLSGAGRLARATALAGFAVEEVGKAGALAVVAAMPENLKAWAPVGRMLEWHQLKLVTGQLIAAVPSGAPALVVTLATMPLNEVADILDDARAFALDVDRLKQHGLYVDVNQGGYIREPSAITTEEVRGQLDRARRAASAVDALIDPGAPAWLAAPGPTSVEFSRVLVRACAKAGHGRTAEAAADLLFDAASRLQG